MMMKNSLLGILAVLLVGVFGCSQVTAPQGGEPQTDPGVIGGEAGGSTSAGNPVILNFQGSMVLALVPNSDAGDGSNLKKITEQGVEEVFSLGAEVSALQQVQVSAPQTFLAQSSTGLPVVTDLFVNGTESLVLLLEAPLKLADETECQFLYIGIENSQLSCISSDITSLSPSAT